MRSIKSPVRAGAKPAAKSAPRAPKRTTGNDQELARRLAEAEETLRAIRSGEVDALVVKTEEGEQVFTLQGADLSYRLLIEDMNEGALTVTSGGMILYANHRFAAMHQVPLETVIGSDLQRWIVPDKQDTLRTLLQDAATRHCREELSLLAGDGTGVPVYLSVSPTSIEGARQCLGVVATDLTEQKQQQQALMAAEKSARESLKAAHQARVALLSIIEEQKLSEQALRVSEARFRNVFENSPLGKSMASMDGEVRVNQAFCDILGYSKEELRKKSWEELTHPDDVLETADALQKVLVGTIPKARFEKRFVHKDGTLVWADTTITVGRDAAGKPTYVLTAINDITPRKQADAAVLDLKQHLQEHIELERLRLAQNLHDGPLQELYAVIYKLEQLRPRAVPENAEIIDQVVKDLHKTLGVLRAAASELRPPALSRFGLEKAIRSYVEDFRDKNPQIEIKQTLARDSQLLPEAVRLVLFRVLQEALANVVRHSRAKRVELRFSFDAEEARLEIEDNGKGFSVPGDWLGMVHAGHYGLAGMAERISAAGGTLTLDSVPGGRTTVRAVIPYSHELGQDSE